jgi:hypothetical protein
MFIDKDGKTYEYTDTTNEGHVIHHHGTKRLTQEQNKEFSVLMSRAWDNLPDETKRKINKKMELKYGTEEAS